MVCRSFLHALVLVLAVVVSAAAVQAQPSSLPQRLTGASSIGADGREEIRRFGEAWVNVLESGDRDRIHEARRRLTDPMSLGASEAFRFNYGEVLVPLLEPLAEGDDTQIAINAVQAIGMIKTDRALGSLVSLADANNEPRPVVRRHAATLAGVIVRDGQADRVTLAQARVHAALRALSRAAGRETEWIVLVQQLRALGNQTDEFGRRQLASTLDDVLERLEDSDEQDLELMRAVHPTLVQLRDRIIQMDDQQRQSAGVRFAPVLGRVLTIAERHWEVGQDDDDALHRAIGGSVQDSERLLAFLDPVIRGSNANPPTPQTGLYDAWNAGDADRFTDEVQRWNDVLTSNAYARR